MMRPLSGTRHGVSRWTTLATIVVTLGSPSRLWAGVPGPACSGAPTRRTFSRGIFTSPALPAIRLQVAPAFRYLGCVAIRIGDLAAGERHVFAEVEGQRVRRLIILQFEGFLPGTQEIYRYPVRNPVTLGNLEFGHTTFAFSVARSIAQGPGTEADSTRAFLQRQGLEWPDAQLATRFARIVGTERRNELLIFYHENVADSGHSLDEIVSDGDLRPEFAALPAQVTQRALEAFKILAP